MTPGVMSSPQSTEGATDRSLLAALAFGGDHAAISGPPVLLRVQPGQLAVPGIVYLSLLTRAMPHALVDQVTRMADSE